MSHFETIHFVLIAVPLIARVTETSYTIGGTYEFGDERFCASFDFDAGLLPQLLNVLSSDARALAEDQLSRSPFKADLRTFLPHATLACELGENVEWTHNKSEDFCPFRVTKFSK
jgi:hypothetical protein